MPDFLVIFNPSGGHLETDPARVARYKGRPNVLLNPCLKAVKGVPPSQWVLRGNKVAKRLLPDSPLIDRVRKHQKAVRQRVFSEVKFEQLLAWGFVGGLVVHLAHVWGFLK